MSKKKILISIIIFTAIIILTIIVLNNSARYNRISINESKWNNIINSRNENKNLVLEEIEFNDYNLIIDEKNNTLYYSLINDSKNKYNPKVSFKAQAKNVKIAILLDEITDEKVKSDYKFKIMIYNDKEYHIYNLICTDLPILNIKYNENDMNKNKKTPMEIYLIDNLSDSPNKIVMSKGKLKIEEDKYVISLNMTTPGKNIRENRRSILNMRPNSEYALKQVNDSQIDLEIEDKNLKGQKEHRVVLFLNNEYRGVYSVGHNDA